ncbi:hypothetical protein RFL03_06795 [Streptococcus parasuis]|uniref:hypothetical protein n=1 Tax=Streptococcus parasuis TaxID=1501662 RepID=UPI002080637C|nr:hypothetical protein SUT380_18790 [Streptococcus parasuis]GIC32108.1 hypothetical protein SUT328_18930 [Streptococcus parasuis]
MKIPKLSQRRFFQDEKDYIQFSWELPREDISKIEVYKAEHFPEGDVGIEAVFEGTNAVRLHSFLPTETEHSFEVMANEGFDLLFLPYINSIPYHHPENILRKNLGKRTEPIILRNLRIKSRDFVNGGTDTLSLTWTHPNKVESIRVYSGQFANSDIDWSDAEKVKERLDDTNQVRQIGVMTRDDYAFHREMKIVVQDDVDFDLYFLPVVNGEERFTAPPNLLTKISQRKRTIYWRLDDQTSFWEKLKRLKTGRIVLTISDASVITSDMIEIVVGNIADGVQDFKGEHVTRIYAGVKGGIFPRVKEEYREHIRLIEI